VKIIPATMKYVFRSIELARSAILPLSNCRRLAKERR
jgi:hypothetical protein